MFKYNQWDEVIIKKEDNTISHFFIITNLWLNTRLVNNTSLCTFLKKMLSKQYNSTYSLCSFLYHKNDYFQVLQHLDVKKKHKKSKILILEHNSNKINKYKIYSVICYFTTVEILNYSLKKVTNYLPKLLFKKF